MINIHKVNKICWYVKVQLFLKSVYFSSVIREAHEEHEKHVQASGVLHKATPLLNNNFHSATVSSVLVRWRHTEEAGDEVSSVLGHRRHFAHLLLCGDDWHYLPAGMLVLAFRFHFIKVCAFLIDFLKINKIKN